MKFKTHHFENDKIAELVSEDILISETGDILNVIANAPVRTILIHKEQFDENFFDLSTGCAGEILQKISDYKMRLGIIGDLAGYTSQSLNDFIFECNTTKQIIFAPSVDEALKIFSS